MVKKLGLGWDRGQGIPAKGDLWKFPSGVSSLFLLFMVAAGLSSPIEIFECLEFYFKNQFHKFLFVHFLFFFVSKDN